MFQNKKKNLIAICFSLFYMVMLTLRIDFSLPLLQNFRYTVNSLFVYLTPMIAPVVILILAFTYKKDYKLKTWLLPIAFGVNLILSIFMQISNIANINVLSSMFTTGILLLYLCSFLMCLAMGLIFIGTLFNFRYINLTKYGVLGYASLTLATLVIDFINVGGFSYIQSVPEGYPAINIIPLALSFSNILFYIGIFILTTNKKNSGN